MTLNPLIKIGFQKTKIYLWKKEQEILYKAAAAYTGLISAKRKFVINSSNVNLLERQVETDWGATGEAWGST